MSAVSIIAIDSVGRRWKRLRNTVVPPPQIDIDPPYGRNSWKTGIELKLVITFKSELYVDLHVDCRI